MSKFIVGLAFASAAEAAAALAIMAQTPALAGGMIAASAPGAPAAPPPAAPAMAPVAPPPAAPAPAAMAPPPPPAAPAAAAPSPEVAAIIPNVQAYAKAHGAAGVAKVFARLGIKAITDAQPAHLPWLTWAFQQQHMTPDQLVQAAG